MEHSKLKIEPSITSKNPNLIDQGNPNPTKTLDLHANFSPKNPPESEMKVNLQGWYKIHQNWGDWVEKLALRNAVTWESTGICDGILSSLHEIRPNPEIVLGLCEYWCSKTNTFVFPWGEATITLEDVFVLSGLPVVGDSVNLAVSGDSCKILEQKLRKMRRVLGMASVGGRVSDTDWINHFNVECGDVEHVGFLAFWLSSFVFNEGEVGSSVFSIAVNLHLGVKIALAPAVLACLYQSLTFLTQHGADTDSVCVSGPLQIVQLWALERFPLLGSKLAKPLRLGQPRLARWDQVNVEVKLSDVRSILRSAGGFSWRPYAMKLENWRCRPIYLEHGKMVSGSLDDDDELISFWVFVQPQELVGIKCRAMYYPQLVTMQFECDREVSLEVAPCSPLESKLTSLAPGPKSSESTIGSRNVIHEGDKLEGSKDDTKPVLAECNTRQSKPDCHDDSPPRTMASETDIEIVSASSNDRRSKRTCSKVTEDQSLEGLVILDSDEEVTDKLRHKGQLRKSGKKAKTRNGDSPENPLFIADDFGNVQNCLKRSGISLEHPIDVEHYFVHSD